MQTYDVDEFSISKDEFKSVGESHYILLVPSEDKTALTIKLMEQEKAEEE
jgi:hypothetical protein